jgi:hypothetical protein
MKLQGKMILLVACSFGLFCSCASLGPDFHPNPSALKLGQLKNSEYIQLFGEPNEKQNKTTIDGKYEIVNYEYIKNSLGMVSSRVLILEFKNGILNGYEFVSSFDEDKTKVNFQSADRLRAGINKLSQSDVIAALGEPNGKALCPSTLSDYKDRCAKGAEIWGWFMTEKLRYGFSHSVDVKSTDVYVVFNAAGKVVDVQTEENSQKIYHN